MTLAIDLDVFNVGSTPLQMLLVVLIITVLVGLVIIVVTQIFSPYLNRRWPATAPLSPTELLWGEAGGHVKRTFRGLDLEDQKDLASQLNERKVPAGAPITSQGDPATAFYLLKSGTAEAVQVDASGGERKLRDYAEGDSFGEVAILERSPRTATVRALTDVVVLELPAEDFVAAAAQTAAEGNDFTVVARQFLVADRARARIAAGEPALNPVQQIQQAAPSGAPMPAPGNATVSFEVATAAAAATAAPSAATGARDTGARATGAAPSCRSPACAAGRASCRCGGRGCGRGDGPPGASTRSGEPGPARDPRASGRRTRLAGQPPSRGGRRSRAYVGRSQRAADRHAAGGHPGAADRTLGRLGARRCRQRVDRLGRRSPSRPVRPVVAPPHLGHARFASGLGARCAALRRQHPLPLDRSRRTSPSSCSTPARASSTWPSHSAARPSSGARSR